MPQVTIDDPDVARLARQEGTLTISTQAIMEG